MTYYVIIRGPLGCGKSTIAKALTKKINGKYFAVDEILDKHDLTNDKEEGYISQKSFLKVNDILVPIAKDLIEIGTPAVFDGNFYWKSQIEDLIKQLGGEYYVFTLKAPLKVCIDRDSKREKTHGEDATRAVYKKSTEFDYGEDINTENKSIKEIVREIKGKIK